MDMENTAMRIIVKALSIYFTLRQSFSNHLRDKVFFLIFST